VWLLVFILAFRSDGFVALMLICVAGALRPPPLKEAADNQRLGGSISALVTIPLVAVLLGSESALAFMRSTQGLLLLIALWAASVLADIPFYRALSQARASTHAISSSQPNVA
jgi:hypothetical protein